MASWDEGLDWRYAVVTPPYAEPISLRAAKVHLKIDDASYQAIDAETPAGSINGTNTAFVLDYEPFAGSLILVYTPVSTGISVLWVEGVNYTRLSRAITATTAPLTNDTLKAYYRAVDASPSYNEIVETETPTGAINASNTTFTLDFEPVSGSLMLFYMAKDSGFAVLWLEGASANYTISGRTITANAAPLTGDTLYAYYRTAPADFPSTNEDLLLSGLIASVRQKAEVDGRRLVMQTNKMVLDEFPCGRLIEIPYWPVLSVSSITYIDSNGTSQTLATTYYNVVTDGGIGRIELATGYSWPTTYDRIGAVTVTFLVGYGTPFTVATSTDILTLKGRTAPANGTVVRVSSTDSLPAGLNTFTDYYVISSSGSTCKLSLTSGGSAVDITSAGIGTQFFGEAPFFGEIPFNTRAWMFLQLGHLYTNREAVITGTIINELPGIQSLLQSDRLIYSV